MRSANDQRQSKSIKKDEKLFEKIHSTTKCNWKAAENLALTKTDLYGMQTAEYLHLW